VEYTCHQQGQLQLQTHTVAAGYHYSTLYHIGLKVFGLQSCYKKFDRRGDAVCFTYQWLL
jgi:hypothetical protein